MAGLFTRRTAGGIIADGDDAFQRHVAGALDGPLDGMDYPLPESLE